MGSKGRGEDISRPNTTDQPTKFTQPERQLSGQLARCKATTKRAGGPLPQ